MTWRPISANFLEKNVNNLTVNKVAKSIRAVLIAGALGSVNAYGFAEDDVLVADVEESQVEEVVQDEEIERVEVTGSRIKSVDLEGVSPVTVIDASEMAAKGFATAFDALKDLTANTGTTQGAEMAASGGFTPNAQTVSLRGLGNNQVLVLVNGRRMADYPSPYNGASNFVNLSSIPMAAIARIEVVTSGASAVYGSDAVAGVMNIITKKDVEDTTVSVKAGTTTEGGGDEVRFQLVSGTSGDNFSVTGSIEYQHQDPIYSADRDFMDSVEDGPAGHQYLDRGIVVVDEMVRLGWYEDDEETEDIDESWTLYRDPTERKCLTSQSGYEYTQRIMDEGTEDEYNYGHYCGTDLSGTKTIRNERDTVSAYLSGTYELGSDTELFSDVLYTYQEAFVRSGFHFLNSPIIEDRPEGDGNMAALLELGEQYDGAQFFDYHTEQRLFAQHELGFRDQDVEDSSLMVNVGIKGVVFDEYDWDITFSRSENTNESRSSQLKEEGVKSTYLGEEGDYWDGVFYYTGEGTSDLYDPVTQDMRDVLIGNQHTSSDSYSNSVTGVISGMAFEMPAGDAYFAFVAEWNEQGYEIDLDDRTLNRTGRGWWNLTGTEGGGERERYAVGLELELPIIEDMNLKLAGRYDQYDDDTTDVGGRFSPQVGWTYKPVDTLLLRANWGQSFRAPDMHRVFATEGGYYTSSVDWSTCEDQYYENARDEVTGEFPDDLEAFSLEDTPCPGQSIKGNSSGSKTLKEEEGTNYGIGFVWDVTESLDVKVDWYKIELEQVVTSESVGGILQTDYYCKDRSDTEDYPFEVNDRPDIEPGSVQCLENADKITRTEGTFAGEVVDEIRTTHINVARQTVEGIDASMGYRLETNYGDWRFNLAWTHTLDSSFQASDDSEEIHTRDLWWNHDARSTMNGSVSWMQDDLSVTLSGRRTGSIPIWRPPEETFEEGHYYEGKVERLDPYYTFNLTAGYRINDNLMVSSQVVNIFNPEPPKDDTHTSWPYYNGGQYGGAAVGRTVSAEMIYTF